MSNKSQATLAKAQFKHISVICTRSCTVQILCVSMKWDSLHLHQSSTQCKCLTMSV